MFGMPMIRDELATSLQCGFHYYYIERRRNATIKSYIYRRMGGVLELTSAGGDNIKERLAQSN